jgi:plasmid stabilization system protein ParE
MHQPIILPLAKQDILEAALWYNARGFGLGKRFTEEVREKVQYICQNPQICFIRYDDVRVTVLNVFPYMIHYTIDESNKRVIISAVLHTSRDQKLWKSR